MGKAKAIYKGKTYDKYSNHGGHAVHLFYEYREHEYMITDSHNGAYEPLWKQHKQEQQRIDREIAEKEKETQTGVVGAPPSSPSIDDIMSELCNYWDAT